MPEDRLTGTGRTIPVRFVVIPATSPDKAPDPVVYFAGGPGGSTVDEIPSELTVLQSLNVHRDLVFIEQRGTGQSNPLNCPVFAGSLADKPVLRASIESCLAHLHGDLRFYTTAMYADDVNQLLVDLHYAQVNLMGISYGTTVEQVFLLRHPGRVRTMTLQSGARSTSPCSKGSPGTPSWPWITSSPAARPTRAVIRRSRTWPPTGPPCGPRSASPPGCSRPRNHPPRPPSASTRTRSPVRCIRRCTATTRA